MNRRTFNAAGLEAILTPLPRLTSAGKCCARLHVVLQVLAGARHAIIPVALTERMMTPVSQAGLGVFVSAGPTISHQGRNFGFDSIVAAELNTGRIRATVTNRSGAIKSYTQQLLAD